MTGDRLSGMLPCMKLYSERDVELSVQRRSHGKRPGPASVRAGCRWGVGTTYSNGWGPGTGGMAIVYRAYDEVLKREVAVKLIAERLASCPEFVKRFRHEARLCARLAHTNIVAVLDAGAQPRDFIVMEFVDWIDGRKLLRRRGRLTPRETVHVVAQICDALTYAHHQGVVHGDASPSNILLRRADSVAKLVDFGLASRGRRRRVDACGSYAPDAGAGRPRGVVGGQTDTAIGSLLPRHCRLSVPPRRPDRVARWRSRRHCHATDRCAADATRWASCGPIFPAE